MTATAGQADLQGYEEELGGFERGIDRESPRTRIKKGGYEDATNMLLTAEESGQTLAVVKQDLPLDPLVSWPAGNPVWHGSFTYSDYDPEERVLDFNTHVLIARTTGQVHRYDPPSVAGTAGTVTNVRRGMTAGATFVNFVYDQWLGLVNGRDAPMKYGQHFLWNGQLESTPYLFPFGSRPISPLDGTTAGETWVHQAGSGNKFEVDARVSQGARVGIGSLKLFHKTQSAVTFDAVQDYTAPPQPYGGDALGQSDSLLVSTVVALGGREAMTGTLEIRFHVGTSATKYFKFLFTPDATSEAWVLSSALRSTATNVGGAVVGDWDTVQKVTLINNDKSVEIFVDDLYWLYANAPPALAVAVAHKTRVVGGGAPVASTAGEPTLSNLFYSDGGHPDNYPATNFQRMSGGFNSLAQAAAINALREFGDQIIVGCPQAIFAWTIGDSGNPVKSTISTEHGIDSHRGIVETPQGSLLFPWQHGFYILRSTGRQYASAKIRPFVDTIDLTDPSWTTAVVDEVTKTIRLAWRTTDDMTKTSKSVIYDYVRAQELSESIWPSSFSQLFDYASEAIINGERATLYIRHGDPQLYRMGVLRNGIGGSVTLPWVSKDHADKLVKWLGVGVAYKADTPITVEARYANIPASFSTAQFVQSQTLPASTKISEPGRCNFSGPSKWAQFRLSSAGYFELYPPLVIMGLKTVRAN